MARIVEMEGIIVSEFKGTVVAGGIKGFSLKRLNNDNGEFELEVEFSELEGRPIKKITLSESGYKKFLRYFLECGKLHYINWFETEDGSHFECAEVMGGWLKDDVLIPRKEVVGLLKKEIES